MLKKDIQFFVIVKGNIVNHKLTVNGICFVVLCKIGVFMKLIVGLGNPGKEYDKTRHNVGFMVMDRLADVLNVSIDMKKFKGEYAKLKYQGEDVILLKPIYE